MMKRRVYWTPPCRAVWRSLRRTRWKIVSNVVIKNCGSWGSGPRAMAIQRDERHDLRDFLHRSQKLKEMNSHSKSSSLSKLAASEENPPGPHPLNLLQKRE